MKLKTEDLMGKQKHRTKWKKEGRKEGRMCRTSEFNSLKTYVVMMMMYTIYLKDSQDRFLWSMDEGVVLTPPAAQ
jgi:hypothetical protein